jgi:hypothetical protein
MEAGPVGRAVALLLLDRCVSEYESFGELGRAFDDFRNETRDQLKFITRLVIGTLCSAILAGVFTSFFSYIRGAPGA